MATPYTPMGTATLYHNPHCSKSRAALQWLKTHGITVTVIEYLTTPPDSVTLDTLLRRLKLTPRELMRQGETLYQTLGLDDPKLSRAQLIDALCAHPQLLQRPIVCIGEAAVIARPPEPVLARFCHEITA